MKPKQLKRLSIQEGRLHEFDHQMANHYEERKIGNEWYIKSYNGGTCRWQVSIYSEKSYQRYKSYGENKKMFDYAVNKED